MNSRYFAISFLSLLFHTFYGYGQWDNTLGFRTEAYIYSHLENGNYTNWYEPESVESFGAYISGSKTINRSIFTGGINYENKTSRGTLWPLYKTEYFPYLIYEETSKTNNQTTINLNSTYLNQITEHIGFGMGLSYQNSLIYNQLDPRVKTFGYMLLAEPKLHLSYSAFKIYISPFFRSSKDEFDVSVVNPYQFLFYQHLGMGIQENPDYVITSYSGQYTGQEEGINTGIEYGTKKITGALNISCSASQTKIEKSSISWVALIPEAMLHTIKTGVIPAFSYKGENISHQLSYNFTTDNRIGKEYIKHSVKDDETLTENWLIFGTTDKYQYQHTHQKLEYDLIKTQGSHLLNLKPDIEFILHKEKYYGMVETYQYDYKMLIPGINVAYTLTKKNTRYSVNSGYSKRFHQNTAYNPFNKIITSSLYKKELQYFNENATILSLNATFERITNILGKGNVLNLKIKNQLLITETSNKMRYAFNLLLGIKIK